MKHLFFAFAISCSTMSSFAQTFTLSSKDVGGQFTSKYIAANFGCSGSNLSPELSWTNPPEGTKSFAVTLYDEDAPTGSGFWHWVIVDIPATTTGLKRGAGNSQSNVAPLGSLQSINDTGMPGYQGPCPGEGEAPHHYIFTVYALKTEKLGTTANSTAALTGYLLGKQMLAKASIIVYCKR